MRNLASHLGLADAWSLVELQLGCFMSRDPEWMDCSHLAYLMHFQYTAFPGLLYKVQTVQAHWGHIFATMHCCYAVHTAQLLPQISFKCQNVLRTQSKVLKSGPNLKPLSQNTFIIIWSFLYTFIILSFLVYSWRVSRMYGLCVDQQPHSDFTDVGFNLLAWSPEAIKVLKQTAPRHYTKRRRGEI